VRGRRSHSAPADRLKIAQTPHARGWRRATSGAKLSPYVHVEPMQLEPASDLAVEHRTRSATVRGGVGAIALWIVACERSAPPTPQRAEVSVPTAATATPPPHASGGHRRRPPPSRLVDDGGVGDVRIGKAIPPIYLGPDSEVKNRYEIRWIADAQPFEAFRIGSPPVLAAFIGPFTRWGKSNFGELVPGRFVDKALREARAGAKVEWIVVETSGPRTNAGIGVGSSFAELESAYAAAELRRLPAEFGPRPTCRVTVTELRHVSFQLRSCSGSERGDVARIVLAVSD
jgi:hypothetical protein